MEIELCAAEANRDVAILRLSGHLDVAATETQGSEIVDAAVQCKAGLILDLHAVDFVSSAGLRVILLAREKAESAGKPLAVICAQPSVYKIFKIASLDKAIRFFEDEADALQALWP